MLGIALASSLLAATISADGNSAGAPSALPAVVGAPTADLQEQLEKYLRARRPKEFAFIARVIALVESGRLPLAIVKRTFLWARRQPNHPFQHFERGLRLQARRLGIVI